jgi:hypothetical protein
MDPLQTLENLYPAAAPYLTAAVAVSAIAAMFLPPPPADAGVAWKIGYRVINTMAMNMGHASNASEPTQGTKP